MTDGGGHPSSFSETLGGDFGMGAIHQVFSFRLHFVFGIDGMNVIVHACTIENEEAVGGVRGSEGMEL